MVFGTFISIPSHLTISSKKVETKRKEHFDPSARAGTVTPMPASS